MGPPKVSGAPKPTSSFLTGSEFKDLALSHKIGGLGVAVSEEGLSYLCLCPTKGDSFLP